MVQIEGQEVEPRSFIGGVVDCVVDEVMGLVQLAMLLVEIRADLDLAADGEVDHPITFLSSINEGTLEQALNNSSASGLAASGLLQLNPPYQGASIASDLARAFGGDFVEDLVGRDLPWLTGSNDTLRELHRARLIAKFNAVHEALVQAMDEGCDFLAAYDLTMSPTKPWSRRWFGLRSSYNPLGAAAVAQNWAEAWDEDGFDIDYDKLENFLPAGVDGVLDTLAAAISFFFEEDEWATRARRGRQSFENVVQASVNRIEGDPWGTAGYTVCLIVLTLIPVAAVTKVVRALRRVFDAIDAAGDAASVVRTAQSVNMADELARAGPNVPEDRLPEPPARTRETAEPVEANSQTPAQRGERPQNVARVAQRPTIRRTPQATSQTTNIGRGRRPHVTGQVADRHVAADLLQDYPDADIVPLRYGGDNGVDWLVIQRDPDTGAITELINVEAKGTASASPGRINLSSAQQRGPRDHLETTLENMGETPLTEEISEFLELNPNSGVTGEIRTARVDPETGELLDSGQQPWTASTTQYNFNLDTPRGGIFVDADEAMQRAFANVTDPTKHGAWADRLNTNGWFGSISQARRDAYFQNIPWLSRHFDSAGNRLP